MDAKKIAEWSEIIQIFPPPAQIVAVIRLNFCHKCLKSPEYAMRLITSCAS